MLPFDEQGRLHFHNKEVGDIIIDNEKIIVLDADGKEQFVFKDGNICVSINYPTYSQLYRFKKYWDELYGQGLEVAWYHYNGVLEPFDNFYESAIEYMNGDEENE